MRFDLSLSLFTESMEKQRNSVFRVLLIYQSVLKNPDLPKQTQSSIYFFDIAFHSQLVDRYHQQI